jgi:hypothetical protein
LHRQWLKHGPAVIDRIIKDHPEVFFKTVAAIMPKVIDVDSRINVDVKNEFAVEIRNFEQAYKLIGAQAPQLIESQPVEEHDEEYD